MPLWQWLVDGAGAVLLLIVLAGFALVYRRRWVSRGGGTFELSFRVEVERQGRGWILGAGRYTGAALECFRIFSFSPRPKQVLVRSEVEYLDQRLPAGNEAHSLYAGHVVVRCRRPQGDIELAMAPGAVTGFLAWLEAAPPGRGNLPV